MGMSSYANHVNTISEDTLKKVCKAEYNAFQKALGKADTDFDSFARSVAYEEEGEFAIGLSDAYDKLQNAFRKATKLYISLNYHDPEASERGDDVSGGFWEVGGVRDFTPAAKKFMKKYGEGSLTDSFFCTYG